MTPLATIFSAAQMMEHWGISEAAKDIEAAIAKVLADGKTRTPDLGGKSGTKEVTDAVLERLH